MDKKIKLFPVNLRMFDIEGEAGAQGTEIEAVNSPQPEGANTNSESVVIYGKEDTANNAEGSQTNQATDNKDSNAQSQDVLSFDLTKLTTPQAREEAFKRVKETFKDEYSKDFQGHFDRRFKDHKDLQAKVQTYDPIIETLMSFYGAKDTAELQKAIDDDLLVELAEKEGFPSVEKFKEYKNALKDGKKYQSKVAEEQSANEQQATVNRWINEGIEFKKKPGNENFDLSKELANESFKSRLIRGMSVEDAYYLAHKDNIINDAAAQASKQTEENVVKNIEAKGKRIPENGVTKTPGVVRKADPSKLTEKDLEDIAQRVARGEKIVF
jgi:hypothetical protein